MEILASQKFGIIVQMSFSTNKVLNLASPLCASGRIVYTLNTWSSGISVYLASSKFGGTPSICQIKVTAKISTYMAVTFEVSNM